MASPKCTQCKHFYITWDPKIPNGCRHFGIQCKVQPSQIVAQAGMGDCQGFEPKQKPQSADLNLDLNRKDLW